MVTVFVSGFCWWLSLFLLNRSPWILSRGVVGILLGLCAMAQAAYSIQRADLALNGWFVIFAMMLSGVGILINFREARQNQESPWLSLARSFDASFFTSLVFVGQVIIVAHLIENESAAMIALLFGVLATAILAQTLSGRIESTFDRFAFAYLPTLSKQRLNQARADLRAAAAALPEAQPITTDLNALDDSEFTRLTRRALSSLSDLPKLSTSPLIHLPAIEQRLIAKGGRVNTLERAVELKHLLAESIGRLKPNNGDFGTAPEWRHYNALYFPYVVGLKPYLAHSTNDDLQEHENRDVLRWFQREVPERTLYNWQNAAAKLVAADLRHPSP